MDKYQLRFARGEFRLPWVLAHTLKTSGYHNIWRM